MAGGIAQRSDYIEGMKADSYDYFLDAMEYDTEPSIYESLCEVKTTTKSYEKATSVVEATDPREREEGQDMTPEVPIEGFTTLAKIKNFYKCTKITKETMDDHQKLQNFMRETTQGWARDMVRGKNKEVMRYFNYGAIAAGNSVFNQTVTGLVDDPSGNLLYDDIAFFNLTGNTRSSKGGGTYYNHVGALSLTPDNFETAWNLMATTNAFNEDDTEISLEPSLLLCNKTLDFTARRLLESTLIPGEANNDKNVLEGIVDLKSTNYFSDTDGWILMDPKKGMVFYQRETPVIDVWFDHKAKIHWMSIEERYGVMIKNWRYYVASNLATT
jgi:hypothetical protein